MLLFFFFTLPLLYLLPKAFESGSSIIFNIDTFFANCNTSDDCDRNQYCNTELKKCFNKGEEGSFCRGECQCLNDSHLKDEFSICRAPPGGHGRPCTQNNECLDPKDVCRNLNTNGPTICLESQNEQL